MNFKGNKGSNRDFIVSFRLDANDFKDVRPAVYKKGQNKVVDSEIFERSKGAKLDIQASNFEPNRKNPCAMPVSRRDSQPHLYSREVKAIGTNERNIVHYPEKPDAPSYVQAIFNAAKVVEVAKTSHGGVYAACAVKGDIRKFSDGYSIDPRTVKPVNWSYAKGTFEKQMTLTNETKANVRNVVMNKGQQLEDSEQQSVEKSSGISF